MDLLNAASDRIESRRQFIEQSINVNSDDWHQVERLTVLMRAIVQRHAVRFRHLLAMKTDFVESWEQRRAFEKGYMMRDIVETYRKGVVFTKKQMNKKRYTEADRLRYLRYIQNAYIKVYHLVHMMHEIDAKHGTDNAGQMTLLHQNYRYHNETPAFWNTSGFNHKNELDAIRQTRLANKKRKVEREKAIREYEANQYGVVSTAVMKTTTNWWPVAYGWDMDYYW